MILSGYSLFEHVVRTVMDRIEYVCMYVSFELLCLYWIQIMIDDFDRSHQVLPIIIYCTRLSVLGCFTTAKLIFSNLAFVFANFVN